MHTYEALLRRPPLSLLVQTLNDDDDDDTLAMLVANARVHKAEHTERF